MVPQTQYVQTAGVTIAYQVVGNGPVDLVLVPGFLSNIEVLWEEPRVARFLHKLASFSRLIIFDKRGTGLSDRVTDAATLEERMDDVRAVMDKIGSERAALFGYSEGGSMCALFAATWPERTAALIMAGSFARRTFTEDYVCAPTVLEVRASIDNMLAHWGEPVGLDVRAPSVAQDPAVRQWYGKYLRMSASPAAAYALATANVDIDIRHLLPSIRTPALILHAGGDRLISPENGRFLARNIPGARFVEIRSTDHLPFFDGAEQCLAHIQQFVTGVTPLPEFDSRVCTIMFTDIVGSTDRAVEIGDRRYYDLLESHHVKDLVAGSGLKFTDGGMHSLGFRTSGGCSRCRASLARTAPRARVTGPGRSCYECRRKVPAAARKPGDRDMQWPGTRFACGTTRTPRRLPAFTPRPFPTVRSAPCTAHPPTIRPARRATR